VLPRADAYAPYHNPSRCVFPLPCGFFRPSLTKGLLRQFLFPCRLLPKAANLLLAFCSFFQKTTPCRSLPFPSFGSSENARRSPFPPRTLVTRLFFFSQRYLSPSPVRNFAFNSVPLLKFSFGYSSIEHLKDYWPLFGADSLPPRTGFFFLWGLEVYFPNSTPMTRRNYLFSGFFSRILDMRLLFFSMKTLPPPSTGICPPGLTSFR